MLTKYWKQSIKFNIPLIPHYLSSIILASSDKVMIQKFSSEYYVGLYSVSYSFANLSNIVFNAINNSYTPWAYRAIKEKNYVPLKKRTNLIILVCVLFCIALMLFAPEGLYLLGGEKYLESLDMVPILIAGTFLSSFYFVFANIEFVNKKTKFVFPITICGASLNILLNWIFIPMIGYKAAAYTTFVGYLFISACHYVYSRIIAKQNVFDLKTILALVLLLTVASFASIMIYKLHFLLRYLLAVVIGAISVVMLLRILTKKNSTT
jgi:O-antigen/teichoic acid export membrane protein